MLNQIQERLLQLLARRLQRHLDLSFAFVLAQLMIAKRHLKTIPFTDEDRRLLIETGLPLRRADQAPYRQYAMLARHNTITHWDWEFRNDRRGENAKPPAKTGRPRLNRALIDLVLELADKTRLGYLSITQKIQSMGFNISHGTVRNILNDNDRPIAPDRDKLSHWKESVLAQAEVTWAGDFFSWTCKSLLRTRTFHVLFFIHVDTRELVVAGIHENPTAEWTADALKKLIEHGGPMANMKILIRDGDSRFKGAFAELLEKHGIESWVAFHPDMNAYAERAVSTFKQILRKIPFMGEGGLLHALRQIVLHYNAERPHQGIAGRIPKPCASTGHRSGGVVHETRLGRLLHYCHREAA